MPGISSSQIVTSGPNPSGAARLKRPAVRRMIRYGVLGIAALAGGIGGHAVTTVGLKAAGKQVMNLPWHNAAKKYWDSHPAIGVPVREARRLFARWGKWAMGTTAKIPENAVKTTSKSLKQISTGLAPQHPAQNAGLFSWVSQISSKIRGNTDPTIASKSQVFSCNSAIKTARSAQRWGSYLLGMPLRATGSLLDLCGVMPETARTLMTGELLPFNSAKDIQKMYLKPKKLAKNWSFMPGNPLYSGKTNRKAFAARAAWKQLRASQGMETKFSWLDKSLRWTCVGVPAAVITRLSIPLTYKHLPNRANLKTSYNRVIRPTVCLFKKVLSWTIKAIHKTGIPAYVLYLFNPMPWFKQLIK